MLSIIIPVFNEAENLPTLLEKLEEVLVVADQFGSPTYAGHIANALLELTSQYRTQNKLPWGTYNFCDSGITTWHMFAVKIMELGVRNGLLKDCPTVRPIRTDEFPTSASRPAYSTLDCKLFLATFPWIGISSWELGLDEMIAALATRET